MTWAYIYKTLVLLIQPCPFHFTLFTTLFNSPFPVLLFLPCPTLPTLFNSPFSVLLILPCPTRPTLSNSLFPVPLVLPCPTHPTLSYSSFPVLLILIYLEIKLREKAVVL